MSSALLDRCADSVQVTSDRFTDFVPSGSTWVISRLFGTDVVLACRADVDELDRRQGAGLGALLSSDHLELLMSLPVGWPVPVASLSYRDQRLLRRMPAGVVRVSGAAAERLAVSPVNVDMAVVPATRWQLGLERAGRFAPFAARMMWLPQVPSDADVMVGKCRRYGIGVMAGPARDARVLVQPAPFVRRRFTAAGWLFTEQVHANLR